MTTSCPKPNPERSLRHPTDSNFVLGNAQAKDRPIVYCSDGFCELTGFARAQVMSKPCACRFLWGQATEPTERQKIEDSLLAQRELQTEVVFYKKTGSQFVCLLDIVPIKNEKGDVVLFLASHKDITKQKKAPAVQGGAVPSQRPVRLQEQEQAIHSLGGGSAMPEYKVQEVKKSRCILLHYGLLKISWDWLILLFTFYIAIMVPYNAANSNGRARKAGTAAIEDAGVVIDLLVEVVFIAGKLK
uniref:PAC domain-containing protein n=1 Tax=Macrostomum lignano TaxID=282301 RepID=A0A1I8IQT2_9PLAT